MFPGTKSKKREIHCRLFVSDTGVLSGLTVGEQHWSGARGENNISIDDIICVHGLKTYTGICAHLLTFTVFNSM